MGNRQKKDVHSMYFQFNRPFKIFNSQMNARKEGKIFVEFDFFIMRWLNSFNTNPLPHRNQGLILNKGLFTKDVLEYFYGEV
jgi:hypothetical protein